MELFVEQLLVQLFGSDSFSEILVVERVHRSLAEKPRPGQPPRPIIARILNYRNRDKVLQLNRENPNLEYEGSHVSFYPDFTQAVQDARRAFVEVKKVLRSRSVKYSMLYPSKLHIE